MSPEAAPVSAASSGSDTATELKRLLAQLEAEPGANAEEAARVVELLKRGISATERLASMQADAQRLQAELAGAPARQQRWQAELDALKAKPAPASDVAVQPEAAAGELRVAEADLSASRQKLQALNQRLAKVRELPARYRKQIVDAQSVLGEIELARKALVAADQETPAVRAGRLVLDARQRMRNAEIASLEQQLAGHDQLLAMLTRDVELAQTEVTLAEARAAALHQKLQAQRAREAADKTREARANEAALAAMPQSIRRIGERATELARTLADMTRKEGAVTQELARTEARLQEIGEDLAAIEQRVAVSGLNESIALVLHKQQQSLPTLADYKRLANEWRKETSWAAGVQIDVEQARPQLADIAKAADRILAEADPPMAPVAVAYFRPRVEDVLRQIKDTLDPVHRTAGRYIKQLGRLDNAQRQLVSQAEKYDQLITEHLLWVRSTAVLSSEVLPETADALDWLLSPANWTAASGALWKAARVEPWRAGASLLLLVLLVASRRWLWRVVVRESALTLKVRTDRFGRTVKALLATTARAVVPALLFVLVGWQLQQASTTNAFVGAVGAGLLALAYIVLGLNFLTALMRDKGIGDVQFNWPASARHAIIRQLRWLAPVIILAGFCIWTAEAQEQESIRGSLGRIAFIVAMLALALFIVRVLRPSGELLQSLEERNPDSIVCRLQYLWLVLAAGAPLGLAVLAASGYYYSALQLQNRLQATAWLVILLVVAGETLMRWLYIAKRRLAYQQAVEERLAERRARRAAADGDTQDDEGMPEVAEPEVSAEDLQQQAGSVVRTAVGTLAIFGLWAAWADVLPALNVLNEVVLWQSPTMVDGTETRVPVTLVHLAVAVLIAALAWVGARSIPAAVELLLLNQTSLDAGAKYAFSTLLRYVIAGVGVTVVFNLLGMEWSKLQWLVAALSVGLGFGLQEIVANFVSGLILLFERPIRIGDVVTVNGATGTVSRIQIRATTLVDFDRKELIMPNKVFITSEVLNWTLSDHNNRILINVGVAYGSDTRKAMELMLEVARAHPQVLLEPEPVATFEGFGDSALNLVLRAYMGTLSGRLGVITELHNGINDAFAREGIPIPFPQRDVHLDTSGALEFKPHTPPKPGKRFRRKR